MNTTTTNEHKRNVLAGFVYRNHIMKFKKYQDIKSVTFGKRRYWNPPSYISIVLIDLITNQLVGVCGNIFKSLDQTIRRR